MKKYTFLNKKSDFFAENQQFSKLIKFYSRKAKEPNIEAELWAFLWCLKQRKPPPINDKYIAVCIRNEYIKLSKFYDSLKNYQINYSIKDNEFRNYEIFIDLKNALKVLTDKEKNCFILKDFYGFSIYEIASFYNITPQAVSKNRNRAIKKLRNLLS